MRGTSSRTPRLSIAFALATAFPAALRADEVPSVPAPPEVDALRPPLGDGVSGVRPLGLARDGKSGSLRVRRRTLPRLDRDALLEQDERIRAADPFARCLRTGVRRSFPSTNAPRRLEPTSEGVTVLADGTRLWTFELVSPGALALRLHLRHFDLPRGAEAVLYDADEPTESYGPFVLRGPDSRGAFHAPTVFGERVRLEVRVPAERARERLVLTVGSALEKYRGQDPTAERANQREGSCHNDVLCDSTYGSSLAYSVGRIDFPSGGSCTGCLMNDYDDLGTVPWFLTAHHCISSEIDASGVEVYWNYFASSCGGAAPSLSSLPRTYGATLVTTSSTTDVTLLRLTGTIPSNRVYSGWTTTVPSAGASLYCAHHPGATRMRISYATLNDSDSSFHNVTWTNGVTEPGSSGSPLVNASGQVIGQLWGGISQCGGPYGPDSFGRFDVSYPFLKPSLYDYRSPVNPPPGGGGGGGGGGPIPPAPVGPPLDFYFGLWQNAMLEHSQYQQWDAYLFRPTSYRKRLQLKVKIKGPKGAWARIVDPLGEEHDFEKKGVLYDPLQGEYRVELHASATTARKRHRVRVSKNW